MKEQRFLKDEYSLEFIKALEENNLDLLRKIPKSDLHNHFVLGGNREYIYEKSGHKIDCITKQLASMDCDDVLIFDSDVSKEYMRLYKTGCLNAKELDDIRINGIKNK